MKDNSNMNNIKSDIKCWHMEKELHSDAEPSDQEYLSSLDDEDENENVSLPVNTVVVGNKEVCKLPFQALLQKIKPLQPRPQPHHRSKQVADDAMELHDDPVSNDAPAFSCCDDSVATTASAGDNAMVTDANVIHDDPASNDAPASSRCNDSVATTASASNNTMVICPR
jgi:hypothetical protein